MPPRMMSHLRAERRGSGDVRSAGLHGAAYAAPCMSPSTRALAVGTQACGIQSWRHPKLATSKAGGIQSCRSLHALASSLT